MLRKSFISLLFGAIVSIGVISTPFSYTKNSSSILKNNGPAIKERAGLVFDDADPVELDRSEMTSYIVASTSTPTATEVTVQFSSIDLVAYGNTFKTVYMVIDDANFAGITADDPYLEPSEDPFNGYIAVIKNIKNQKDVVIPETYQYGTKGFLVRTPLIETNALDLEEEVGEGQLYIETISIPAYVETINPGAFVNMGTRVQFLCEATEKPEGWADDWTDADPSMITWGAEITPTSKQQNAIFGVNEITLSKGGQYIVGYDNRKDEEGNLPFSGYEEAYHPLIAHYETKMGDETIEHETTLPLVSNDYRNLPYDGVGKIGSSTLAIKFDIEIEHGEEIDYSSFWFENIYVAKKHETLGTYCCDVAAVYSVKTLKRFTNTISILDIITYKFSKISTFCGYTLFEMKFDLTKPDFYSNEHEDIVNNFQPELTSKKYRVRYAFYRLTSSSVELTIKDGDGEISILRGVVSPTSTREISNGTNKFSFILQNNSVGHDFQVKDIISFKFLNLVIDMHLWNNESAVKVGRTEFSYSFGSVDIYNEEYDKLNHQNLDLFLILFYILYTIVYAAVTAFLFFFLKNKYKNDEFRRMKPKQYFKKAVIGYAGLAIILLAALSIIYRFGVFANTIAAFNPADVFVVFAGIVGLIVFGYFIKYFYTTLKARKARRVSLKLKLNNDIVDDGTK